MKNVLFCILFLILTIGCSSERPANDADDLIRAVFRDDVAALRALLEKGVDVNTKCYHHGATALWAASVGSHLDIIKVLLESGADVNTKNTDGATALYVAAQNGHLENVKLLLESGADVNVKRKTDSTTALWIAAHNGQLNIVKLLLERKADMNAKASKDGKDYTPLSIAKEMGHTQTIKLLKEYGAKD
ncbi:MAG TPA: ankyrin repeat domain-containing protein [Planctomycetes bacterium]|nr:ankyrin repeat domain-containing protein [Planctomycetota bacterium]